MNEPERPSTSLPQEDWPPSAFWLYDEVDLSEAVPKQFVHRVLMQRSGADGALLELQLAFSLFAVRAIPLLAFPSERP